jgi:hypothetical protein
VTSFVLSHNLQIQDSSVPALAFDALAAGLKEHCSSITTAEVLSHPHWKLRLESTADPAVFAHELATAWRSVRQAMGHNTHHAVLALGGRKDSVGSPGAPLQQGGWGVDVVETVDPEAFLTSINWTGLTASRPADGVVEVINRSD